MVKINHTALFLRCNHMGLFSSLKMKNVLRTSQRQWEQDVDKFVGKKILTLYNLEYRRLHENR